jgi:putative endonuclease
MSGIWFAYIMTNYGNTVLYVGITNNLNRRIWEHKNYKADSFTKKYNLFKLVWFEEFPSPLDAIQAEKKLKGWTRKKKCLLIEDKNPNYRDLMTLR